MENNQQERDTTENEGQESLEVTRAREKLLAGAKMNTIRESHHVLALKAMSQIINDPNGTVAF